MQRRNKFFTPAKAPPPQPSRPALITCPGCHGTGGHGVKGSERCSRCNGSGKDSYSPSYSIRLSCSYCSGLGTVMNWNPQFVCTQCNGNKLIKNPNP